MPLTADQIRAIRENMVLDAETKTLVLESWEQLTEAQQQAILKLVGLAIDGHHFVLTRAAINDPHLTTHLRTFVETKQSAALKISEQEEQKKTDTEYEKLMAEIQNM